jgi:hypothetical protein
LKNPKNPFEKIRMLTKEEAENLSTFTDYVRSDLHDKVMVYLTWTADIRFGWKRKKQGSFVGCYVRWHEKGSPGQMAPTVFFCSKAVPGFETLADVGNLGPSLWERYAGCRHYKAIENPSDARIAANAVRTLFELTSLHKGEAGIA